MSFSQKLGPIFKVDGEDHIRVSSRGLTLAGRMTSHDYKFEFFIPHLGDFLSPVCFANWLASGVEEARFDPSIKIKGNVPGYRNFLLYAKFWQLCKMRPRLINEKIDLPFVSYRVHQTGIKEINRWKEYAPTVKEMIEHVLDSERGPHTPFPWSPNVEKGIDKMVKKIAIKQGYVPEEEKPKEVVSEKEAVEETPSEENEVNLKEQEKENV